MKADSSAQSEGGSSCAAAADTDEDIDVYDANVLVEHIGDDYSDDDHSLRINVDATAVERDGEPNVNNINSQQECAVSDDDGDSSCMRHAEAATSTTAEQKQKQKEPSSKPKKPSTTNNLSMYPAEMPSVERRRRRRASSSTYSEALNNNNADLYCGGAVASRIDYNSQHHRQFYGMDSNLKLMGVVAFFALVFVAQRGEVVNGCLLAVTSCW